MHRCRRQSAATRSASRRGFSLVELLVVIAVIATLVGVLIPAVQRARESSRRSACGNQIKNMGLAVSNYEAGRKAYPPGWDVRPQGTALPGGNGFAWSAYVLSYLDESALASQLDFKKRWDDAGGNAAAADRTVPAYVCPSGILPFPGKMDYGGIMGHSIVMSGQSDPIDNSSNRGILVAVDNASLPPVRASSVTDGLSHTLLVAESVDRMSDITPAENIRWIWGANSFAQNAPFVNTPRTENIRSTHDRGAHGVFADGRVMFLGDSMSPDILAAICTRNGDEKIASAVNAP